jgi:hypothetical protein
VRASPAALLTGASCWRSGAPPRLAWAESESSWRAGRRAPTLAPIAIDSRMRFRSRSDGRDDVYSLRFAPAPPDAPAELAEALRDGAQGATPGLSAEPARCARERPDGVAVVLLLSAGLMLKSLDALMRIDLGFRPEGVLTLDLRPPEARYEKPESVVAFYRALLESVRGLPGVEHAGLVRLLPLATEIGDWGLDVEGFVETPGHNAKGDWQVASDGALDALGERLVAGRALAASDMVQALPVTIVNETFARTYWRGRIRSAGSSAWGPTEWIARGSRSSASFATSGTTA